MAEHAIMFFVMSYQLKHGITCVLHLCHQAAAKRRLKHLTKLNKMSHWAVLNKNRDR